MNTGDRHLEMSEPDSVATVEMLSGAETHGFMARLTLRDGKLEIHVEGYRGKNRSDWDIAEFEVTLPPKSPPKPKRPRSKRGPRR